MLLRIKVKPGSRKDEITREADGTLKVKVKAPPVEGKANQYLLEYLGSVLGLAKSKVVLLKGESSQFKTLDIAAEEAYVNEKLSKF